MKKLTPEMKALMTEMMERNKQDIETQWAYLSRTHTHQSPWTKSKLDLLIQEAAKLQQRELSWIGNLFQERLKELQKANQKMKEWEASNKD